MAKFNSIHEAIKAAAKKIAAGQQYDKALFVDIAAETGIPMKRLARYVVDGNRDGDLVACRIDLVGGFGRCEDIAASEITNPVGGVWNAIDTRY
jgi:hypothetical protein